MLNKYLNEQPISTKILQSMLNNNKLSHAYLFETNNYNKSLDYILDFVKEIVVKNIEKEELREVLINQIDNGTYIDLKIIEPDGMWIKKEQMIDLQKEFSTTTKDGYKKIYIITETEKLNSFSANTILKFLEEPENDIIAILMTNNKEQLLETIISRCVQIKMISNNTGINNNNLNTAEKIANSIYNNKEQITEFLEEEKKQQKISKIINFIKYYENNKIHTLLYMNKMWHQQIKEKDDYLNSFDQIILFYKDVINEKLNRRIEIYSDYEEQIKEVSKLNKLSEVIEKIKIIISFKEKIRYNANSNLLMEKFIISLGGVNCD